VFTTTLRVYCISVDSANGPRKVLNLKADVLRALWPLEGTLAAAFGYQPFPGPYTFRPDLMPVGVACGVLDVLVDFNQPHA
jgi:hypothetical protein